MSSSNHFEDFKQSRKPFHCVDATDIWQIHRVAKPPTKWNGCYPALVGSIHIIVLMCQSCWTHFWAGHEELSWSCIYVFVLGSYIIAGFLTPFGRYQHDGVGELVLDVGDDSAHLFGPTTLVRFLSSCFCVAKKHATCSGRCLYLRQGSIRQKRSWWGLGRCGIQDTFEVSLKIAPMWFHKTSPPLVGILMNRTSWPVHRILFISHWVCCLMDKGEFPWLFLVVTPQSQGFDP